MATELESLTRELRYLRNAIDRLEQRVKALENEREREKAPAEGWEPRPSIYPAEWE